jgi:ABC-type multidrug transport system fused ATPase/permease subunit
MQTAMASSERIFNLLDQKIIIPDPERPSELKEVKGKIEFRNVHFDYLKEDYVLKNLSFNINRCE